MGLLTGISLFSGAGGLDLAAKWAGIRTVCYVENDAYAQGVLMSRFRDGGLDDAPIWDDVRTFDGTQWRGKVDCVFGGFPCQDISLSGKMEGIDRGVKSGLWREFRRTISQVGPRFVIVENVPGDTRWIIRVRRDLREIGYLGRATPVFACQHGAPFPRERVFVVAHAIGQGREKGWALGKTEKHSPRRNRFQNQAWDSVGEKNASTSTLDGMANGLASRLDRIRCCGNGVVPQQAYPFFKEIVSMSVKG